MVNVLSALVFALIDVQITLCDCALYIIASYILSMLQVHDLPVLAANS